MSQTIGAVTTNYDFGTGSDLLATQSVGGTLTQTLGYTPDGRMTSLSPGIQAPGGQYITLTCPQKTQPGKTGVLS